MTTLDVDHVLIVPAVTPMLFPPAMHTRETKRVMLDRVLQRAERTVNERRSGVCVKEDHAARPSFLSMNARRFRW